MKKTQNDMIVEYLTEHKTITANEALTNLGIARLASRVHDLKALGYSISSTKIPVTNRFGETCWVSQYSII